MNRISHFLCGAAIAVTGLALSAEDFQPLMKAAQTTWPEKQHIGVICNYSDNQSQVMDLARAAGEGSLITVVDTRNMEQANLAATLLVNHKAEYVVLMPKDRVFRDGSFGATLAVNRLAKRGVPAIGTTPVALEQGAVFSIGDGTEGQLLVTSKLIGTVDVILPERGMANQKSAMVIQRKGMATIAVHQAK